MQDKGYENISLEVLIKDFDMFKKVFKEEYIKRIEKELDL